MKQYLIEFIADYYCQGTESATFMRLVSAETFERACNKIQNQQTNDYFKGTCSRFRDLTIHNEKDI